MYRVIMLAALMLSLMGGLWVMSGSAPLAAQTTATAVPILYSGDNSSAEPRGDGDDCRCRLWPSPVESRRRCPPGSHIESINPGEDK